MESGRIDGFVLFCILLCVGGSFPFLCRAEIKEIRIKSDPRPVIMFEKFGFTRNGHVAISVKNVDIQKPPSAPDPDPGSMGFFLLTDEDLVQVLLDLEEDRGTCVLNSPHIKLLFSFKDLDGEKKYSHDFPIPEPNAYTLLFASCHMQYQVSMDVHTEMYNMEGKTKVYLPIGQIQLPKLYFCFFVLYLAFFGSWIYVCVKEKATLHRIHILMGALLLFKALDLICEAEDKSYIKRTGSAHGWDIAFYFFGFLKGVLLFTVIVLIGTGWSLLKPFLQDREKKVLMVVIPLQVFLNIVNIVIDETGPFARGWFTWKQVFLLVDIICCCAILFPIVWSIRNLREASKTDGKAAKNLEKLTLFRQFYIVLVGYLYFTRIVVFALTTITAYKYQWVSNCAAEFVSLAFYIFMFYNFRPVERNPYIALDKEEEEAAVQLANQDNDFEL
eukprot:TRINITY_DN953_c0_g1_i1.p1 TRINITY_DN953_c0_g1~~TRINITY_DN953_c0_g1_i1.p1  ORF type:complete len:443 (+),score=65.73 TRINITY_DN953_c0_g1_i1:359-1687(+)